MCHQPPGTDVGITFKSSLMKGRFRCLGGASAGGQGAAAHAMPASRGRGMDAPWPGGGGRSLMRAKGAGAEGREVGDGDGPTERMDKRRGGKKRKGEKKEKERRKNKKRKGKKEKGKKYREGQFRHCTILILQVKLLCQTFCKMAPAPLEKPLHQRSRSHFWRSRSPAKQALKPCFVSKKIAQVLVTSNFRTHTWSIKCS